MQVFNEWINSRIKMSFQEKYNMLTQRLSVLNNMKSSADNAMKEKPGPISCCGCGYMGLEDKPVEQLISDVDAMWDEIKKDIMSSVKAHEKMKSELPRR